MNPVTHRPLHLLFPFLVVVLAACGDDASSTGTGGSGGAASSSVGSTSTSSATGGEGGGTGGQGEGGGGLRDFTGRWEGTATVEGIQFLETGSFPAVLTLAQSGEKVRGVLDIKQDAAEYSEYFGYLLEGVVSETGLSLELTDRICGDGDPIGLCMPNFTDSRAKVFAATLSPDSDRLTGGAAVAREGVSYEGDIPVEPPFVGIELTATGPAPDDGAGPIAGEWLGKLNVAESAVYAGPMFFGTNEMTIAGSDEAAELTRFDNNGLNIYPTDDELILADTFRYDPSTRRFWLLQAGTIYGRYIWIGEQRGDSLVGHLVSDALTVAEGMVWTDDGPPIDPFEIDFASFEGTFVLSRP